MSELSGGMRTKAKLLARDPDHYRRIGAMGGKTKHKGLRGFAKDKQLASKAGQKGGASHAGKTWSEEKVKAWSLKMQPYWESRRRKDAI